MKYPTVFHLISSEFEKAKIPIVLIGGFALNYYKVTRQTADTDFLMTREDFSKALVILEKEGYKTVLMENIFVRLTSRQFHLMDLDILFVEKETLNGVIEEGKEIRIAGQKFIVPSVTHLIAMKLHAIKSNPKARLYKDFPDIIGLIKISKVNIKTDQFRNLCLKYGTNEVYHKILDAIG